MEPNGSPQGLSVVSIRPGHSESSTRISAHLEIPAEVLAVFRWIEQQNKPFTGSEAQTAFPKLPFDELKKIGDPDTRAIYQDVLVCRANTFRPIGMVTRDI